MCIFVNFPYFAYNLFDVFSSIRWCTFYEFVHVMQSIKHTIQHNTNFIITSFQFRIRNVAQNVISLLVFNGFVYIANPVLRFYSPKG